MAPARSKTLLCKLTLRVCIAGSEQEDGGSAGRRDGVKKTEKIKRQRAARDIKRGDSVNRRKGIMDGVGRRQRRGAVGEQEQTEGRRATHVSLQSV